VAVQGPLTPIRANIVGPPDAATWIKASLAACHSCASCSALRKLRDVGASVLQRDELAPARQRYGIVKRSLATGATGRFPVRRHALASIEATIFLCGPSLLIAPHLKVGLASF
jgi:hypothetical protein